LHRTTSFDVFCMKIGSGAWEEPGKKMPSKHLWCPILCIRGKEITWGIVTKFCMWVDIGDIIMYATIGDDSLWGFGMARGQISHFPIDLRHRPYNTLVLPCECVMLNTDHSQTLFKFTDIWLMQWVRYLRFAVYQVTVVWGSLVLCEHDHVSAANHRLS